MSVVAEYSYQSGNISYPSLLALTICRLLTCVCCLQDLGSPSEKIWPGYSELPAVKKMTFTEYPYNHLRKRFGALLSDQGFDLMNK